ncbi:hypothetical protein CNMCM8980_006752 [Aspergillus fumigatiaffinis]|nr:hypothetical protein CNMCM8980_006752 [Aspergillus fumigatiaffinis]
METDFDPEWISNPVGQSVLFDSPKTMTLPKHSYPETACRNGPDYEQRSTDSDRDVIEFSAVQAMMWSSTAFAEDPNRYDLEALQNVDDISGMEGVLAPTGDVNLSQYKQADVSTDQCSQSSQEANAQQPRVH